MTAIIYRLAKRKVSTVASAGNNYSLYSGDNMDLPACISPVVSVAATNRLGTAAASYTSFSASTDLFAPGGEIYPADCVVSSYPASIYSSLCGTSMASPHVAGSIAALRSKVVKSPGEIVAALRQTGTPIQAGSHTIPLIKINNALQRLLNPVAPANDNFAQAETITPPPLPRLFGNAFYVAGSNVAGTLESGEPPHVISTSRRSVWYKWTPDRRMRATITTQGSGFDTVMAIYKGATVSSLGTPVAKNDDMGSGIPVSSVSFYTVAGTTYRIAVAGRTAAQQGNVGLTFGLPPANDDFANRKVAANNDLVGYRGSNLNATFQTGEPVHLFANADKSVWYRFTALASGPMTIDTIGSPLDTVLAIYTGSYLTGLTQICADDQGGGGNASKCTFNVVSGTTYSVAVTGYFGQTGAYFIWFTPPGISSPEALQVSVGAGRGSNAVAGRKGYKLLD